MSDELALAMAAEEDAVLLRTPSLLSVNLGNGEADEVITFAVTDGTTTWANIDSVTLDEYGTSWVDVLIPGLVAGSYTLSAAGTITPAATLAFTVTGDLLNDVDDGDTADLPTPPTVDTAVTHWRLVDSISGESYTFVRNPKSWTNPLRPTYLEHEVTTAPDGQVLAWQGGDRAWPFSFSGYLETQAEYDALEYWASLRRRFWLVDHRHRVHYVTFEKFDAVARLVPGKPWAHDYTVAAIHFYRQDWDGEG